MIAEPLRIALIIFAGLLLLAVAAIWYARRLTPRDVMSAYAKDAVDAARRNFQAELDYSEDSIRRLEELVGRQHDEYVRGAKPTDQELEAFCKMWGAYLGEVMRKHHGGDWSLPKDGVFQGLYVLTVKQHQTSPPAKVYQRIVDGDGDNLHFYYQAVVRAAGPEMK